MYVVDLSGNFYMKPIIIGIIGLQIVMVNNLETYNKNETWLSFA